MSQGTLFTEAAPAEAVAPVGVFQVVDLFPTRYEATRLPETWCILRPAADGTIWHCRRDGKRSQLRDFTAVGIHGAAAYSGEAGSVEVRPTKEGWWADCTKSVPRGEPSYRHIERGATLSEVIRAACIYLEIPPPNLIALDAAAADFAIPSPPACVHDTTPIEACTKVCRCGHGCNLHGAKCNVEGCKCVGSHDP